MNDADLDLLLDNWEAPASPASLREGLRGRFPRADRRRFVRPLGWVLAIALASAALVVGMEQSEGSPWASGFVRGLDRFYENLIEGFEIWRVTKIVTQIRQSEPKVYVNGQLVAPLAYGHGASMDVQVPGEGVYSITLLLGRSADGGLNGWAEAGHIHGNVIEFQAGSKQVRIVCTRPIVNFDRPIFVMRRP